MKKFLSLALVLLMLLALFAACSGNNEEEQQTQQQTQTQAVVDDELTDQEIVDGAKKQIDSFYSPAKNGKEKSADFTLPITAKYSAKYDVAITWTVEQGKEFVSIGNKDDKNVTILVDTSERGGEFVLKGVLTYKDAKAEVLFTYEAISTREVIEKGYALAPGEKLDAAYSLKGKISEITTAYGEKGATITVIIKVAGFEDKPIKCYAMVGDGIDTIKLNDVITVNGVLTNYNGEIEFGSGCKLIAVNEVSVFSEADKVAAELSHLPFKEVYAEETAVNAPAAGKTHEDVQLTYACDSELVVIEEGKITFKIGAQNETVKLTVTAVCGATSASKEVSILLQAKELTAEEIVNLAYALEKGAVLKTEYTLTGKITAVNTAYASQYSNITVTITVGDMTDKPIMCYRMINTTDIQGEGVELIKVGDVITVKGYLKNYNGTIEFDTNCMLVRIDEVYQLTDAEKVEYVLNALSIPASVNEQTEVDLPAEGRSYSDVKLTYVSSDTALAVIEGGKLTLKIGAENTSVTVTATATCGDATATKDFNVLLVARELTAKEILDMAYALAEDTALDGSYTLTGKITKVNTAYDAGYKNITVTIVVGEYKDQPVMCYRMKGEGADTIKVGDTITVTGVLKNYRGTIEFDTACTLDRIDEVGPDVPPGPVLTTPEEILTAAYALEKDTELDGTYTLTGKITVVNDPFSAQYNNIQVTIVVEGFENMPMLCYRMKNSTAVEAGAGVEVIKVGDTITVTGKIKNYNGKVEFDAGCTLDRIDEVGTDVPPGPVLTTPEEILTAAYALEKDTALTGSYTLTGKITQVKSPYDAQYKNIQVVIVVEGFADKPMLCYRMKNGSAIEAGAGVEVIKVGDTITVTGTIKNFNGTVEFDAGCTLDRIDEVGTDVPPGPVLTTPEEILTAAYALDTGAELGTYTLTGKITKINTAYDSGYKNVTVTIACEGIEDKPIQCFRMKGEGADTVKAGDTITVTGKIKNYNGTVEFDAGCTLDKIVEVGQGGDTTTTPPAELNTPEEILTAAYALDTGAELGTYTLTGKITKINTAYDSGYKNVTVTIAVEGLEDKPIQCFRMKGEGADTVKAGDTITVTGKIKNYNGTVEFDAGCTLDKIDAVGGGGDTTTTPNTETPPSDMTPEEILTAAYALEKDKALDGTYTLTGKIIAVNTAYNAQYGNVSVTIAVEGLEDKPIQCFRMKNGTGIAAGAGVEVIKVNDVITCTGNIKNYNGTVEFDAGCTLDKIDKVGENTQPTLTTPEQILTAAYELKTNTALTGTYTLTGTVTTIVTAYNAQYGNVTVTIVVDGFDDKPVQCYRLKNGSGITAGEGVENLQVGDVITVTGNIKNYNGTVEYDQGCTLDSKEAPDMSPEAKAKFELNKISLPSSVNKDTAVDLVSTGATYTTVSFSYASDSALAEVKDGKLNLKIGEETTEVTITVTASCEGASETKTFKITLKVPSSAAVTDTLNNANTYGKTDTKYMDWTCTGESGAVYVGQSGGGEGSIQLRTNNNNSGIVVTVSGGNVQSVTITFNAKTAGARVVNVYGKNEAYTAATDLYDKTAQGTLLGKIAMADPQTITVDGDYAYIGICSDGGALYIESIEIVWA